MDFNALQHKLFALDPVDPREDIARLKEQASVNAPTVANEQIDYLKESAAVPEGSLKMDRNYSIDDFAALAGVVNEKRQRPADQVRGSEPMPKAKPGRTDHPYQDRLVGDSIDYELDELEVVPRGTATPANISQTLTSIQSQLQSLAQTIQQLQNSVQQMARQPQQQPQQQAQQRPQGQRPQQQVSLSSFPSMQLNSVQNKKKPVESIDSIKETLYTALNKKMGVR
jgi:hypothetical protein